MTLFQVWKMSHRSSHVYGGRIILELNHVLTRIYALNSSMIATVLRCGPGPDIRTVAIMALFKA